MAKFREAPTRGQIEGKIEKKKDEMKEKEVILDNDASDIETIRRTLSELHSEGPREDVEQVERHIETAEDVTEQDFNKEDESLEKIQAEGKEFEGEIEGRKESSEADVGKIEDASAEFKTREAKQEFEKVKAAALEGIDFLEGQEKRASNAREESEAIQEKLRARAHSGKKGG